MLAEIAQGYARVAEVLYRSDTFFIAISFGLLGGRDQFYGRVTEAHLVVQLGASDQINQCSSTVITVTPSKAATMNTQSKNDR